MPRIRTLKPEHRQHRKVGPLDHFTYRLWVGIILEADDDGRLVYDPAQLRAVIFPYHAKVTLAQIDQAVGRLTTLGLARYYTVDGQDYLDLPSWGDHQVVDRKRTSKLPEYRDSPNDRRMIVEPSTMSRGGSEGKGTEGNLTTLSGAAPDLIPPNGHLGKELGPVRLLDFLNRKTGRHFQATPATLALIRARLHEATEDQIRAMIAVKCRKWLPDAKMAEYLRPKTLFNATNFSNYLGELPATAFDTQAEAPDEAAS